MDSAEETMAVLENLQLVGHGGLFVSLEVLKGSTLLYRNT